MKKAFLIGCICISLILGMEIYSLFKLQRVLDNYDCMLKSDYSLYLAGPDSVIVTDYYGKQGTCSLEGLSSYILEENE